MPQFRKKPTVIEAVRYDAIRSDREQQCAMLDILDGCTGWHMVAGGIMVPTANGAVIARHGDWVCRQVVNGKVDVWPCADEIFAATYEPVN